MRYLSIRKRRGGSSRSGSIFVFILTLTFTLSANSVFSLPKHESDAAASRKAIKEAGKLSRGGSIAAAESILRRSLEADPESADIKIELAYVLVKQKRLGEAYEIVFPTAKENLTNARAFAVLGMTLLSAGRFDDARLILDKALVLNKKEALAWAGWGMLEFYENKIEPSLGSLQTAVHYDPRDPDYLYTFAQVSARFERYAEAAEAYRRFLNISGKMDKERRERINGLISFLDYLGRIDGLNRPKSGTRTEVPFEIVGDRPVITVRINRKEEPLRFVLDTGSGMSILSVDTAKRLKIKSVAKGGHGRGLGGSGKFEIIYGLMNEISIGDVSVKNVPVYIRQLHDRSQEIDGYIGLSLISKFLTTIDYGSKIFTLDRTHETISQADSNPAMSLPLRLTSSGFLSGEVMLQGIDTPLNFIVDTGASISVISSAVAKDTEISPYVTERKIMVIGSAGVTKDVPSYQLPKVTFGKHARKDIMAIALDLGIINETSGFEQSGILGGNFLKNYKLVFDFRNARVTFTPLVPVND